MLGSAVINLCIQLWVWWTVDTLLSSKLDISGMGGGGGWGGGGGHGQSTFLLFFPFLSESGKNGLKDRKSDVPFFCVSQLVRLRLRSFVIFIN